LRVEVPDPDRLVAVQNLLRDKGIPHGLVPVADLIRPGGATFLAAHVGQQAATDRAYLTAWGATYYLAFERRAIGGPEFETYLTTVNGGGDPAAAFQAWVGQDPAAFGKDLHHYLLRLRPDGKSAPPGDGMKP
jgi:hypothetical protein